MFAVRKEVFLKLTLAFSLHLYHAYPHLSRNTDSGNDCNSIIT
jgi:hypothetical protein